MNHKLFGKGAGPVFAAILVIGFMLASCEDKIPGDPEGVMKQYVNAIKARDFKTIYSLNRVTARQKYHLEQTSVGNVETILKTNYEENKAAFDSAEFTLTPAVQWGEKYFFPPSAKVSFGKPERIKPVGDDPVNAEYEKALTVKIHVTAEYPDVNEAPKLGDRAIKTAVYDCALGKIRTGKSVRVYDLDEKWYFNGCILEKDRVQLN